MSDYIYFDGACEPRNPGGTGGWGFVIFGKGGERIKDGYGVMRARPDMTNNVAEYAGAGAGLKAYQELGRPGPVIVCGDSKLVIEQMSGRWRIKKGAYVKVAHRLLALIETCEFQIEWQWVPRNNNADADAMSVKGLKEQGIHRTKR